MKAKEYKLFRYLISGTKSHRITLLKTKGIDLYYSEPLNINPNELRDGVLKLKESINKYIENE